MDEIIPWAMANGWTDIEVEKLRTIIDKVNSGKAFRGLDYGPIRDRGRLMREWRALPTSSSFSAYYGCAQEDPGDIEFDGRRAPL